MRIIGNGYIRRNTHGVSYGTAPNIKQLCDWDLATNDDVATIETGGYFNGLADVMQVGELIKARVDLDGTPVLRHYLVSANNGSAVTITRASDELASLGVRAVTPTADGLTTGLILPSDRFVEAGDHGDANYIITLPAASAATRGRVIRIWVKPSTNCELRTPATTNQTINNVDSDGSQEALLTHTQMYVATQHLATGWLLQAFTALGAVATAIVPD